MDTATDPGAPPAQSHGWLVELNIAGRTIRRRAGRRRHLLGLRALPVALQPSRIP